MIELPPKFDLWLPPKPAIIRRADRVASFLPGMFPCGAAAAASAPPPPLTVEATNTSFLEDGTSHSVALPASIQTGELLIIFVIINNTAARTLTTPSGWTQLFNVVGGGNLRRLAAYYKVASGSEGSTLVVTASGGGSYWAANSYRISGYQGVPEAATATGSSANPNSPNLTPSWGSANNLWLAVEGDLATSATTPTPPTNYANQIVGQFLNFGFAFIRVASGRRTLTATSEDPGTFTLGNSGNWIAATIAVRPA